MDAASLESVSLYRRFERGKKSERSGEKSGTHTLLRGRGRADLCGAMDGFRAEVISHRIFILDRSVMRKTRLSDLKHSYNSGFF